MKKIVPFLILGMFLVPLIGSAAGISFDDIAVHNQKGIRSLETNHTVLAEYVSTQSCGYCPTASSQLNSIYNAGDLDFYFVTFLPDANKYIWSRVQELDVSSVPDVYFDGGYRNLIGAQSDEGAYRSAINASGARTVPDIDITVDVQFKGGGTLKITVTVQNNEAEEYKGHLRVYVVEPESRWNDASQVSYHFAALGIPIDRSLAVPKSNPQALGDTYTFTRTWFGALYGFNDITEDNIMVIAALFDSESEYVVETAAGQPTTQTQQPTLFTEYPLLDFILQLRQLIQTRR